MTEQLQEANRILGMKLHQTLDSSRENVDDSDMDTASGDCVSCSDRCEVSIQTAHKRYWKRVWTSCRLSKGSLWMEAQLKRISEHHQDVWGHDHECVRVEQKCALAEDCNSFEMRKVMIRTDQMLCITEATGSKIHTRESEAETHGRVKTLVLLLKQYHAHYYQFYEKGTPGAIVGLQGLHMGNVFQCSNMSVSIGLKSFCPWCFKLGGNIEAIATHLREVHYLLDIACNICKPFASMSVQIVLEHHSGCKAISQEEDQGKRTGKTS